MFSEAPSSNLGFVHSPNALVPSALFTEVNGLRREASLDSKRELLCTSIPHTPSRHYLFLFPSN